MADAVFGVPAISTKAEPAFEVIARREQVLSEAAQVGDNCSQSSVQRAINRQNSVLSRNHSGSQDNKLLQGEPAQFGGNELWTGHTDHVPVVSSKAEVIARREQVPSEAAQVVNNRSQSSVQRAISRQNNVLSHNHYSSQDNNLLQGEPAQFGGNELWTGHTAHVPVISPKAESTSEVIARREQLPSVAAQVGNNHSQSSVQRAISRQNSVLPQNHYGSQDNRVFQGEPARFGSNELLTYQTSHVPVISPKVNPSFEVVSQRKQVSSEAAQPADNRLQSSVQRAVGRQNSSLSQITPEPKEWQKIPELPITVMRNSESVYSQENTANSVDLIPEIISAKQEDVFQHNSLPFAVSQEPQHGYPAISSNNITNGESGNSIHSNSFASLLMRSAIISPERATQRIHASLGQHQPSIQSSNSRAIARKIDYTLNGNTSRPVQPVDLHVLRLSPRANLFSGGEESFTSPTTRTLPIEQGDSLYSDRTMDRATHLPLSKPYVVQRKTALSGGYTAEVDGSGYLQRQEVNNTGAPPPSTALVQDDETAGSVSGKSNSNALSTDDIVDKVWRKLMRKLVSEQERTGGSNRWA
jgi:hypothetical protein